MLSPSPKSAALARFAGAKQRIATRKADARRAAEENLVFFMALSPILGRLSGSRFKSF